MGRLVGSSTTRTSMTALRLARQCHPSADCKDNGDVTDGRRVSLTGRPDGPSGRADATAYRVCWCSAAITPKLILLASYFTFEWCQPWGEGMSGYKLQVRDIIATNI